MTEPVKKPRPVATYSPASPELYGKESERLAQVSGLLGKIWGDASHAPANIAGLALVLIFLFGGVVVWIPTTVTFAEYLKFATPILTLILGYLFGKKS